MMLIDCIVYIGLFFLITSMAFGTFYVCWDNSKDFRRTGDDLTATLRVGELWRADIRSATAMPTVTDSPDAQLLRIPVKSGEINYCFSEGSVTRRDSRGLEWTPELSKLKDSRMIIEKRSQVTLCRWEVELSPHVKNPSVTPLFTFEAVPSTEAPR